MPFNLLFLLQQFEGFFFGVIGVAQAFLLFTEIFLLQLYALCPDRFQLSLQVYLTLKFGFLRVIGILYLFGLICSVFICSFKCLLVLESLGFVHIDGTSQLRHPLGPHCCTFV